MEWIYENPVDHLYVSLAFLTLKKDDEVVPGSGPRPIPNETFGMRITRSSVGFVGSGYFNNYQEPMIDHHSSDRFLAGRDYVRIVFDYPLLRLTYFNRQTVLVVAAECR